MRPHLQNFFLFLFLFFITVYTIFIFKIFQRFLNDGDARFIIIIIFYFIIMYNPVKEQPLFTYILKVNVFIKSRYASAINPRLLYFSKDSSTMLLIVSSRLFHLCLLLDKSIQQCLNFFPLPHQQALISFGVQITPPSLSLSIYYYDHQK